MPINPRTILAHEWTGLTVTIRESSDPKMRGLSGLVRNETKNTISIEHQGRTRRIAKSGTVFIAKLPSGETLAVEGRRLRYRPEDRIKKGLARW